MDSILFDGPQSDSDRRSALYDGQLFVYSASPGTEALCALAREMLEEAFAPHHPTEAQYHYAVEDYAAMLGKLKPAFIHHPRAKEAVRKILVERGCDLERTYFDVPRLRTSTAQGYLTTGIAFAFHPHRDTWYSAPACQINWWLPVYPFETDNGMAFHPAFWSKPVKNSSAGYNYQEWVAHSRFVAAQQIGQDTREQPKAQEEIDLDPQVRIVTPPGGMTVFSGAHLHSSVPNTTTRTRISIDFRTVNIDDVREHRGAPNLDSRCTGTTMGDYLRGSDLAHLPDELVAAYL